MWAKLGSFLLNRALGGIASAGIDALAQSLAGKQAAGTGKAVVDVARQFNNERKHEEFRNIIDRMREDAMASNRHLALGEQAPDTKLVDDNDGDTSDNEMKALYGAVFNREYTSTSPRDEQLKEKGKALKEWFAANVNDKDVLEQVDPALVGRTTAEFNQQIDAVVAAQIASGGPAGGGSNNTSSSTGANASSTPGGIAPAATALAAPVVEDATQGVDDATQGVDDIEDAEIVDEHAVPPIAPMNKKDMDALNRGSAFANVMDVAGGALGKVLGAAATSVLGFGGTGNQAKFGVNPAQAGEAIEAAASVPASAIADGKRKSMVRKVIGEQADKLEAKLAEIEQLRITGQIKPEDAIRATKDARLHMYRTVESIARTLGMYGNEAMSNITRRWPTPGTQSDANVKNVKPNARLIAMALRDYDLELSDEDYKVFKEADPYEVGKEMLELGPPFRPEELELLHKLAKLQQGEDYAFDVSDCGIWSPETLQGYAQYIKNSVYTYKPEAQQIDSSIDPNEVHIGPMAQEIEKVIPAAIVETPQGVKTVDTSRLSLANAGAIGDLARQNRMQGKAIKMLAKAIRSRA